MTDRKVNRYSLSRLLRKANVPHRTTNQLQKKFQGGNGVIEPRQLLRNLVYDEKSSESSEKYPLPKMNE